MEAACSRAWCGGLWFGVAGSVRKTDTRPKQWTTMSRSTFHSYQCVFGVCGGCIKKRALLGQNQAILHLLSVCIPVNVVYETYGQTLLVAYFNACETLFHILISSVI